MAIIAGVAAVATLVTGGQASAELQGFTTNDVVKSWNGGGAARRATSRAASRRPARQRNVRSANRRATARSTKQRPVRVNRGALTGIASYYWQPQRVASGGWFNPNALTAAHKTLPFGTRVRVTHLGNGRSVVVRINDRGPYIRGRIIDLSRRAAGVIGMRGSGIARVKMDILGR
jgi:rare lipoprotein A